MDLATLLADFADDREPPRDDLATMPTSTAAAEKARRRRSVRRPSVVSHRIAVALRDALEGI